MPERPVSRHELALVLGRDQSMPPKSDCIGGWRVGPSSTDRIYPTCTAGKAARLSWFRSAGAGWRAARLWSEQPVACSSAVPASRHCMRLHIVCIPSSCIVYLASSTCCTGGSSCHMSRAASLLAASPSEGGSCGAGAPSFMPAGASPQTLPSPTGGFHFAPVPAGPPVSASIASGRATAAAKVTCTSTCLTSSACASGSDSGPKPLRQGTGLTGGRPVAALYTASATAFASSQGTALPALGDWEGTGPAQHDRQHFTRLHSSRHTNLACLLTPD
jgi:hypothetical protein